MQSESISWVSLSITAQTNESSRHFTLQRIPAGKESGVWPSISSRNAKSGGISYNYISPPFTRGLENRQGEQIRGTYDERLCVVHRLREGTKVLDVAVYIGVLDEYTA